MTAPRAVVMLALVLLVGGCSAPPADPPRRPEPPVTAPPPEPLPLHDVVTDDPLLPKAGRRFAVEVREAIDAAQCLRLLAHYRYRGLPDGQVAVRRRKVGALCVHNLGQGQAPEVLGHAFTLFPDLGW